MKSEEKTALTNNSTRRGTQRDLSGWQVWAGRGRGRALALRRAHRLLRGTSNMATSALLGALLLAAGCGWAASGLPLPSFFEKCPKDNQVKLNECATRNVNTLIPHMINGIKKYGLMALDPLYVPKVDLNHPGINLISTDVYLHGMKNANFTSVEFDLEGKRLAFAYLLQQLTINSTYEMDGKILILRLKGAGDSSVEYHDVVGKYEADLDTVKGKDGEDHFAVKDHRFNFTTQRVHYYFSNLLADEALGNATNLFLNENWQDVAKETQPAIAEVADMLFTRAIQGMFAAVSIKDMFVEGPSSTD